MFIRSQDKDRLVNTEHVMVHVECGNIFHIECVNDGISFPLGTYETRERALEVLDMIQDSIEDGMSCHEKALIDKYGTTQSWKRHSVFEMPEE